MKNLSFHFRKLEKKNKLNLKKEHSRNQIKNSK